MAPRIGYLVPEFPGQTHAFFWREIAALEASGVAVDIVSTRRPRRALTSHDWSAEAIGRTTYLFPPSPVDLATPALRQCLAEFGRAADLRLSDRLRLLALLPMAARLSRLAARRGWAHLHVHSCADSAHLALLAHRLSGLPYSLVLHGPLEYFGGNQRRKWRSARFAVAITDHLRREVEARLEGSLPARVHVAPMGVDCGAFRRARPYAPWSPPEALRLFSCGRLAPSKGHADVVRAVSLLRRRGIEVEFSIAGEDDEGGTGYRRVLEALIEELGLRAEMRLLGAASEAVVRRHLEAAHVFVLASHAEALGVALMEAMAMEVPVIAGRLPGVCELVSDGIDGVLVEPGKPEKIAAELARLMAQPRLAAELGRRGRETVSARFHTRRSAEIVVKEIT